MASRVALVTGGASGIGRASALELAKAGYSVVVADVDEAGGQATVSAAAAAGADALFLRTDVSSEPDVIRLMATIRDRYGRLHVAHNNAGIAGERGATHECPTDVFDRVMAVNARGVWLCLKHQVPLMLDTVAAGGRQGSIVITSSTAGLQGMPEFSAYCASKHAVLGMARSAAREYAARGLRVNCICPATTETPMVEEFRRRWPDWQAATDSSYPLGRTASAQEVAEAVVWLASSSGAGFMTGQPLVLDGGLTC